MHGSGSALSADRIRLKISAARGHSSEIGFEPIGTSFVIEDGNWLFLEMPVAAISEVEVVAWPNGVAIWVPWPGDYVVLDSAGSELDRL